MTKRDLLSTATQVAIPADDPIRADFPTLPQDIPVRVDRASGAALVTMHGFPVSPRSLERAPITWQNVNGRALCRTRDLLMWAKGKLEAAPAIRAGQKAAA